MSGINGVRFDNYHTWKNARALITHKKIGSPEIKTSYVNVYGRIDGPIDSTEVIAGKPLRGMRELEFELEIPGRFDPEGKRNAIAQEIHGKRKRIVLDEMPEYRFDGRCTVGELVRTNGKARSFTIKCICDPVPESTGEVVLESISAAYNGGTVYEDTDVNTLDIVVVGHYSDGLSRNVTGFQRAGSIRVGNNTITLIYQGKTATVVVVGIQQDKLPLSLSYSGTKAIISNANNANVTYYGGKAIIGG